jgi:hypothetical protein
MREDLKRFDTDVILSTRIFNDDDQCGVCKKKNEREREKDDNRYGMARQTSWKMTAAITFFYLNAKFIRR